jgi:fructose-1,6-bisphosphatase II
MIERLKKVKSDSRIEFEFVRATEAAAIASAKMVGRGDKNGVDQAAVDAMRQILGTVDVDGMVVIGEGEKDEAPMLYIGEALGTGDGPAVDIAVDPIDGTTLASRGGAGAISVVAAARRGTLFHTRIAYMDKIVVGPAGRGKISIDRPLGENVRALAHEMRRPISEITVALLDRPRNEHLVKEVREIGARIRLFNDGDVATAIIAVLTDRTRIDMMAGIGGAPEGVVTACAVKALGGDMQGRLWLRNAEEAGYAVHEGIDPAKTLLLDDLCAADDALLAATGVTDGELLAGVRFDHGAAYTQSIVISTYTGTIRTSDATYLFTPRLSPLPSLEESTSEIGT